MKPMDKHGMKTLASANKKFAKKDSSKKSKPKPKKK
jgi:hypothetical protein